MSDIINIYCDESCHLINDGFKSMVLGSLIVPYDKVKPITEKIKSLKLKHGMDVHNELKWSKVSNNKIQLYCDIVDFFLKDPDLKYRCVVVPDKSKLDHERFGRTHDNFYYVMYYYCLRFVMKPENQYNIYFDLKDTHQEEELKRLGDYLISETKVPKPNLKLQPILSYESQFIQLCDLLTGAVSYKNRELSSSLAKTSLVELIISNTNQSLVQTSVVREEKFNVFVWTPRECQER